MDVVFRALYFPFRSRISYLRFSIPHFMFIFVLLVSQSQAEEVLRCKDVNGKWMFTDKPHKCRQAGAEKASIEVIDAEVHNTHSHYGRQESKEYFNYAFRSLTKLDGYKIHIIAESELLNTDPELTHKVAKRLESGVIKALNAFPQHWRPQFSGVRFYIFAGNKSTYGGGRGGLWYFRQGNKVSSLLDDSIIVRNASTFLHLNDLWVEKVAVHELAHGFYYYNWRRIYTPLKSAYQNSLETGLYKNVRDVRGRNIEEAYALKNHKEYFAELSAMYFAEGDYLPFNRQGLKEYDPQGYDVMRAAWLD